MRAVARPPCFAPCCMRPRMRSGDICLRSAGRRPRPTSDQCGFGDPLRIGVEGTSSYGAGLARYLRLVGVAVVEIDRPDRRARRAQGKSDPVDAYASPVLPVAARDRRSMRSQST
jgi:transposase